MQNTKMPAQDSETLGAIAELLLWIGLDRAADAIYAEIEAAEESTPRSQGDGWDEVFTG